MKYRIRKTRIFTIADFKEEEQWLREMHKSGWELSNIQMPCFFYFERCEPEDVVYQLDFRNSRDGYGVEYRQIFQDCGWEYVCGCMSFHYFRKPISQMEEEEEIFSDNVSRIDLLGRIWKWRMMPVFVVFFSCVLPQVCRSITGWAPMDIFFWIYFALSFIYIWLILHVGLKLFRMKRQLKKSR